MAQESLYTVELNFLSNITFDVKAKDEGDALQKARDLAEQAPMSSFSIIEEHRSRIVNIIPIGHND